MTRKEGNPIEIKLIPVDSLPQQGKALKKEHTRLRGQKEVVVRALIEEHLRERKESTPEKPLVSLKKEEPVEDQTLVINLEKSAKDREDRRKQRLLRIQRRDVDTLQEGRTLYDPTDIITATDGPEATKTITDAIIQAHTDLIELLPNKPSDIEVLPLFSKDPIFPGGKKKYVLDDEERNRLTGKNKKRELAGVLLSKRRHVPLGIYTTAEPEYQVEHYDTERKWILIKAGTKLPVEYPLPHEAINEPEDR
jgi:hypothetical protein